MVFPTTPTKRPGAAPGPEALVGLLREVRQGRPLSRETACELLRCDEATLPQLLAAARAAKEKYRPAIITYSRKVFLPLTNLCRDYCGYCTFRRDAGEAGAHTMTADEVLAVAREGEKLGCTEALFSLGDRPEARFGEMRETLRRLGYRSTLHYLEAMCELVLRETRLLPHANPGLLSSGWIERLRASNPSLGLMLESTSTQLGAAHPQGRTPDKAPALRLRTLEDAGRLGVPFTTGILIGIGETPADRVDSLLAIRRLHQTYGHIQEVIIQNFRVKPRIPMATWREPGMGDMLRTLAVARLLLRDMNIQAPPNLAPQLAQRTPHVAPQPAQNRHAPETPGVLDGYERLIDGGINDWGGVSPLTPDFINPEAPWPHLADLQRRTAAAGQKLVQRLPVYPEFVGGVVARGGRLAERLRAAVDDAGYARTTVNRRG
ncbi:MAG TPA: 7,8-didemethyl-8-hydroxy-5-deazariboflavin synthase CofG [Candidatus Binatia bacterium]|nr:7,8-didemethyl-8-hydroxy-5-deazariboflavin synthase CofG [Candidatus Binatia bacterium]